MGRLLAERFARGVFVEGDVFRRNIVSGRREMAPNASHEALAQLRLRYRIAAAAADAYFEDGFTVVLEDVIAGPLLAECLERIRSRPLHVVVLLPSIETIAARETLRDAVGYAQYSVEQLYRCFVDDTPRVGLWLDSSDQTPEQTVDEILERTGRSLAPA